MTVKRLLFFIVLVFITIPFLKAQELMHKLSIPDIHAVAPKVVVNISDAAGNNYLIFAGNKELMLSVFDAQFTFQYTVKNDLPDSGNKVYLGHYWYNQNLILVFTDKTHNTFSNFTLDTKSKKISINDYLLNTKEEKYIEAVTYNNSLYLLFVKKNSSILKLHVFEGIQEAFSKEIDFSAISWESTWDNTAGNLSGVLSSGDQHIRKPVLITPSTPLSVDYSCKTNKVYLMHGKMYLVIDHAKTYVLSIDLQSYEGRHKVYSYPKSEDAGITGNSRNSFLYDSLLFQTTIDAESLSFRAINIFSDNVKMYQIIKGQPTTLINTPIFIEGSLHLASQNRLDTIRTKEKMFPKLIGSFMGISVYPNGETLELTIGAWGYNNNPPMMVPASGPTAVSTPSGGTMIIPGSGYGGMRSGNIYWLSRNAEPDYTRSVYFTTYLNKNTLEHIDAAPAPNIFDRVKKFETKLGIRSGYASYSEDRTCFLLERSANNTDFLYGYYVISEKVFYLFRIPADQ